MSKKLVGWEISEAETKEGRGNETTHAIANVALVVLVVRHELGGTLHIAVVELVVEQPVHRHHHRLLHLVRNHHSHQWLHLSLSLSPSQSQNPN